MMLPLAFTHEVHGAVGLVLVIGNETVLFLTDDLILVDC